MGFAIADDGRRKTGQNIWKLVLSPCGSHLLYGHPPCCRVVNLVICTHAPPFFSNANEVTHGKFRRHPVELTQALEEVSLQGGVRCALVDSAGGYRIQRLIVDMIAALQRFLCLLKFRLRAS